MKHKALHLILLTAFLFMLAPFGKAAAQASRTVRIGLLTPIQRIDPVIPRSVGLNQLQRAPEFLRSVQFLEQLTNAETIVNEELFLGLTDIDENGKPIPELATSWDSSRDATQWTFHLRQGVQWVDSKHNPQREVTAQDVAFSVKRAAGMGAFGNLIADIGALDDYTVTFRLNSSYPDFPLVLALPFAKPLPGDLVEKNPDGWTQPGFIWSDGPYLLRDWSAGRVELEANSLWWDASRVEVQRAQIESITNPDAALQRYRGGDFDVIEATDGLIAAARLDPVISSELQFASPNPLTVSSATAPALQRSSRAYLVKSHVQPKYSLLLDPTGIQFSLNDFQLWTLTYSDPNIVIPETTRILNDETLGVLQAMSDDQSVLTFGSLTPQLRLIQIGDILVGSSTVGHANAGAAPFGFLRRVLNTTLYTDGTFVVQTEQATLDEAIERGNQSVMLTLQFNDVYREENLVSAARPIPNQFVLTSYASPSSEFRVAIDHVLYDADQNTDTTNDQVHAKGWVDLDPTMKLDFRFNVVGHELQSLYFSNTMVETSHIELRSSMDLLDFNTYIPIKRFTFLPQVVFIGPLPVVITPEVTIAVGFNGNVSVGISTAIDQKATLTTGLQYSKPDWTTIKQNSPYDYITGLEPSVSHAAQAKAYAGPEVSVTLYGVAGPYGQIHGYLKLVADPLQNPWWTLKGGLEAELGLKVEVMSHVVASYKETLPIAEQVLKQSGDYPTATAPPPGTPPTPTPGPKPGPTTGGLWMVVLILMTIMFLLLTLIK